MNKVIFAVMAMCLVATGCRTVTQLDTADRADVVAEGSMVFERAKEFAIFGSRSPRDYFEVVYEDFSSNEAGLPVLEVGIRYRGGTGFTNWTQEIPEKMTLVAKTTFYKGERAVSPVAYASNRQTLLFRKGETVSLKVVSPVREARSYQVVLGE